MGKHFTGSELDKILESHAKGRKPIQIQTEIACLRRRARQPGPDLTSIRRALKGKTHKRGMVERRGRKRKLTARNVTTPDKARVEHTQNAEGQREVHWCDIQKKARVPKVHRTTASRRMREAGLDVSWRTPRQKPHRTKKDEEERTRVC